MSEQAFIEYPWTATTKENTQVLRFSREEILHNAADLLTQGDEAAKGSTTAERAAWRAATRRGIRKLSQEVRDDNLRLVMQEQRLLAPKDGPGMTKAELLEALKDVPEDMRVVPIFHDHEGFMHPARSVKPAVIGDDIERERMANMQFVGWEDDPKQPNINVTFWTMVIDGGDGSVTVKAFQTKAQADAAEEKELRSEGGRGWGEPSTHKHEITVSPSGVPQVRPAKGWEERLDCLPWDGEIS